MQNTFYENYGNPYKGKELEKLITFLNEQDLDYDEQIEHTVTIEEEGKIIATASCHNNVLKCVAVSPNYQGNNLLGVLMTHMTGHFIEKGITHFFGFTKPKNEAVFCNAGLYPIAKTSDILLLENKKNGLEKYITRLVRQTENAMKDQAKENMTGEGIGAIIANCNPFTLGHKYLVEQASSRCRWLHLFILSQEQNFMTSEERYELVKRGVSDLPNVILHKTSDYLISPAVFPTYFMKDKANAYDLNCQLDLKIFVSKIAPALGITKRFVGSEPTCQVTGAYNQCMKKELPQHGIEYQEISRKEVAGNCISASYVRSHYYENKLEEVKDMLPLCTFEFLMEKRGHKII